MRFSVEWLRTYVRFEEEPAALARRLTLSGLPVDTVEGPPPIPDLVVLGRVVEARPHPNADRLTLCRVDAGGGEIVDVVCGAPNARTGLWSALARVGASLPNGAVIRKSKIRGETSEGMLCSAVELGMGEEANGILELAPGAPGTPLARILGARGTVLDIDVPSNRGDCLSHVGLAREIGALLGAPWARPEVPSVSGTPDAGSMFRVSVESAEDCPRFTAHVIRDVRIGPSPAWLVERLEAVGQRSINNVVDVTNFVMLETGQPLHAFDLDLLGTGRIHVRRARSGERLTTLDGVERALGPEILLITDGERPLAAAGVMGGAQSEVQVGTRHILLEAAWFRPERILRGSRALRLDTEASLRFRRGIDPAGTPWAAKRAAALMAEVAGGTVVPGMVEALDPAVLAPRTVSLRPERVGALLGERIPEDEIAERLHALGFGIERGAGEAWRVAVPSWRRDVFEECDLIEEVARHRGYDTIGSRALGASGVHAPVQPEETRLRRVAEVLRGFGFHEARTRVLTDRDRAVRAGLDAKAVGESFVALLDPPTREEEGLRVSLVPSLLDAMAHNLRHGLVEARLFEIGKTFQRREEGLPEETAWIGLVAAGGDFGPSLERASRSLSFTEFKGVVEELLESFRIDAPKWRSYTALGLVPGEAVEVVHEGAGLGFAWEVNAKAAAHWDLNRPVYVAQVRLDALPLDRETPSRYQEPSRFPAVRRDLALIVPLSISQEDVRSLLVSQAGADLQAVELFDHYRGRHIPEGYVGLGFRLTFRSRERTLEEREADGAVERVVHVLKEKGIERREA